MTVCGWFVFKLDRYYMAQELMHGNGTSNMLVLTTVNSLDQLVRGLELYKQKHGDYPDSLQQLSKEQPFTSIVDPFLGRNSKAHKDFNFHYK
jgi:hypothetical protein